MKKIINIKVVSNAQKSELREIMHDGTQKIALSAIPEKGKANKELIKFYKKTLGKKIKIISGETNCRKRIEIIS
ncbi:TPA: DUF167 domain-containing protein [Candidatus Gracilibacteria bacterium]|nr:DUF167 domain-containing protein [Candidatus Gracilibacteria bacterium]